MRFDFLLKVSFRVRYGAPQVRSLSQKRVNIYRGTNASVYTEKSRFFLRVGSLLPRVLLDRSFLLASALRWLVLVLAVVMPVPVLRRSTIKVHPEFYEATHLTLRSYIHHPKTDFQQKNKLHPDE